MRALPPIDPPRRVLLVRPSALGDVARTAPVLASLRRAFPEARIDWIVQRGFEGVVEGHPALLTHGGGPVLFDRKRFGRWADPSAQRDLWRFVGGLRRAEYDLAIDAQGLLRSGLLTRASGARVRVGFADAREGGAWGLTHKVNVPAELHAVDRMLSLLPAIGVEPVKDLRLYPRAEDAAWAVGAAELTGRVAVLAPTSRWASKQWPADRFAGLAERLLERFDRVVIVGGAGEEQQVGPLLAWTSGRSGRAVNLIGRTSVGRLLAVIQRGAMLVGSDSAAVHMAVGVGTPCVALYGPTDVSRVGPAHWEGCRVRVVQRLEAGERLVPGGHKAEEPGRSLMARIGVDDVMAAVESVTS